MESDDVVINVEDEYSYRVKIESRRERFITLLKKHYFEVSDANLRIYGVPGDIEKYVRKKKSVLIDWTGAKGILPSEDHRIRDEDVYSPSSV